MISFVKFKLSGVLNTYSEICSTLKSAHPMLGAIHNPTHSVARMQYHSIRL